VGELRLQKNVVDYDDVMTGTERSSILGGTIIRTDKKALGRYWL
jgi:hypothetical protein